MKRQLKKDRLKKRKIKSERRRKKQKKKLKLKRKKAKQILREYKAKFPILDKIKVLGGDIHHY